MVSPGIFISKAVSGLRRMRSRTPGTTPIALRRLSLAAN